MLPSSLGYRREEVAIFKCERLGEGAWAVTQLSEEGSLLDYCQDFRNYGYWAENPGEGQWPSGSGISAVHSEGHLGVKLQLFAALGSLVSAGGKVSLLGDADINRKHTGRSMFCSWSLF